MSYSDVLKVAIGLEEKAGKFYLEVAEQSKTLLTTIPGAFKKAAKEGTTANLN